MTRGYLGLGGNLGDPVASMASALRRLDAHPAIAVREVSRLFRTPPWGKLDQPWFVNACALIETGLGPEALLDACLDAERVLKRERRERWGPRTVDLDILTLDGIVHASPRLTLPHPRMAERAFVLAPLCDLAPDLDIEGKTVRARLSALADERIEPLGDDVDWWR